MSRLVSNWWVALPSSLIAFIILASSCQIVDLKITKAFSDLSSIQTGLNLYALKEHRYPTDTEGLNALVPAVLLREGNDPWGTPYVYRSQGRFYVLYSAGADGEDNRGEGDDVTDSSKKYECDVYGVNCPPDGRLIAAWVALAVFLFSAVVGLLGGARWMFRFTSSIFASRR